MNVRPKIEQEKDIMRFLSPKENYCTYLYCAFDDRTKVTFSIQFFAIVIEAQFVLVELRKLPPLMYCSVELGNDKLHSSTTTSSTVE